MKPSVSMFLSCLAVVILAAGAPAPASASRAPGVVLQTSGHYRSGGHSILYDEFALAGGRRPAVLLIHGADGLQSPQWRDRYHRYALELAQAGYAVMVPHYFQRTGTRLGDWGSIVRDFAIWTRALADAETALLAKPGVRPGHVRVVGFSLGASETLTLSSQDPRVSAVVEFFGAMPAAVVPFMRRMPPTLILHGSADGLVSVKEAYRLEALLKRKHVPYQIHIYRGQGHGFTGAAETDALHRTLQFLARY